jgi:hypothetical protein
VGGPGNDELNGDEENDELYGEGGVDTLNGDNDHDKLHAGPGDDVEVSGGPGNDQLFGEGGADVVHGSTGDDDVGGGPGNDKLFGDGDVDHCSGDGGKDLCDGGTPSPDDPVQDPDDCKAEKMNSCGTPGFPKSWSGDASGTITSDTSSGGSTYSETQTWSATGVTLNRYAQGNGTASYEQDGADVTWSMSANSTSSAGSCTYSGSKTYHVDPAPGFGMDILDFDEDSGVPDEYDLNLGFGGFAHVDGTCTEYGQTHEADDDHFQIMACCGDISASGQWTQGATHLSGEETHPSGWNPDYQVHWQWDLSAG